MMHAQGGIAAQLLYVCFAEENGHLAPPFKAGVMQCWMHARECSCICNKQGRHRSFSCSSGRVCPMHTAGIFVDIQMYEMPVQRSSWCPAACRALLLMMGVCTWWQSAAKYRAR